LFSCGAKRAKPNRTAINLPKGPATVFMAMAISDLSMILSEIKATRAELDALREEVAKERAIDRRRTAALEREEPQPMHRTGARFFSRSWQPMAGRCWRRRRGRRCIHLSQD